MKVVDMHCDTIGELLADHLKGGTMSILENPLHIDLKKMKKGDYLLQNFGLFVHLEKVKDPFAYAMKMVDTFYTELEAYPDQIGIVKTWEDLEKNMAEGRMSAMLTLEEGGMCLGETALLRDFYRLGARMMTLTWNFQNQLGYPNRMELHEGESYPRFLPDTEHGLTEKGIEFVQEMERLGMIIDISHLNDAGICIPLYEKALCGKPFQCPRPCFSSEKSDRRDDPQSGRAWRGGRNQFLRVLPS